MTPTQPGPYLYRDPIGGPPQRVEVLDDAGTLVVRFPGMAEGEDIPLADLAGTFQVAP